MTMEQDQEQMQGALYVAVDDGNKIIAMERSRRGDVQRTLHLFLILFHRH